MKKTILNFVRDEQGQDLIEYTLLLAFVCLASAAIFLGMGGDLAKVWTNASKIAENAGSKFS
jgi:Flp pilus assembly pilin Flp